MSRRRSSSLRWCGAAVAAMLAAGALFTGIGTATAAPYHVPWGPIENVPGLASFAYPPATAWTPPGSDRWDCTVTTEHPEPVILVPGTGAHGPDMSWIAPLLANNGYCVYTLHYGLDSTTILGNLGDFSFPGMRDMTAVAADELAPFVDRVLASSGSTKAILIGHSQGTAMPRWYVEKLGGAAKISTSINLAPLWNGTSLLGLQNLYPLYREPAGAGPVLQSLVGAFTHSLPELLTGSDYLTTLNAGDTFPSGVRYTNILTRYDELVAPYTSGLGPDKPNVTNIVLQDICPADLTEHFYMSANPVVGQIILNALDPTAATPLDCGALPRNSG